MRLWNFLFCECCREGAEVVFRETCHFQFLWSGKSYNSKMKCSSYWRSECHLKFSFCGDKAGGVQNRRCGDHRQDKPGTGQWWSEPSPGLALVGSWWGKSARPHPLDLSPGSSEGVWTAGSCCVLLHCQGNWWPFEGLVRPEESVCMCVCVCVHVCVYTIMYSNEFWLWVGVCMCVCVFVCVCVSECATVWERMCEGEKE